MSMELSAAESEHRTNKEIRCTINESVEQRKDRQAGRQTERQRGVEQTVRR